MFSIQAERAKLQKQQELVDLFVVIEGDNMYVCKSVSVCPTDVHITHSTLMTTTCLTRTHGYLVADLSSQIPDLIRRGSPFESR